MLKRVTSADDNDEVEIAVAGDCIARARELAPLIEAHAAETEAARSIAPSVLAALHEARLFRMLMPRCCDGMELEPATYVQVIEEIAKGDASTAWCVAQGSGCSMTAAYLAPDIARDVFGDPGAVLAWGPTDGKQRAVVVEGGYRVSGSWHFASGLGHATWVGGHCVVVEPDGSLRMGDDGKPLDRTMLIPKSSVTVTDVWRVMGLKGTGSNTYSCTDVFVPEAYTLSRESDHDRRASSPLYRFTTFQLYGIAFAGIALGLGRRVLDEFVALAMKKMPYRQVKPLRENAVIQSQIALGEAKLNASRALLLQTLRELWATVANGDDLSLEQRASLRLASVYAAHQAKDVIDAVYHAAGATAIFESNPFERRFRDIHTVIQQVQGQFHNFEVVGQILLGLPASTKLI
jgi:alkylation response protein AidB-like acyl-CoA dehydrogenase